MAFWYRASYLRNIANSHELPLSSGSAGSAAAHRGEAPVSKQDGGSGSLPALVGALWMHWLQQRTQDRTLLLDQLVTESEEWLVDSQAWRVVRERERPKP